MNIHEYQAKAILREFGAPVAAGFPVLKAEEAAGAAKEIKSLISASSSEVGQGVELVGLTGQALQKIVAQSWYWIGGFCAPTDTTTNPTTVPTATNAAYKRAVMVEHFG